MEKPHNLKSQFKKFIYIVSPETAGLRIDKYLGTLPEVQTRSRAVALIESGNVWVKDNSKEHLPKPSYIIKNKDEISFEIKQVVEVTGLVPLDLKLDVYFEDEFLIVLNKPAGLVVHPAAGHEQDTLVNALIHHTDDLSMKFGENRPGIVHRLDKDTSGLMVVAKQDEIHEALASQFRNRTIHRLYQAVVLGILPKKTGRVQSYLARHPNDRKRYASVIGRDNKVVREQTESVEIGKWAVTDFEVLMQNNNTCRVSFVQLKLHTGRTHQIRIHLSEMGCPIVADELYGQRKFSTLKGELRDLVASFPRLALHAVQLGFEHPKTKENLKFAAPWPSDLQPLLKGLGFC